MYLKLWEERDFGDKNKISALKESLSLTPSDKDVMKHLSTRQGAVFATLLEGDALHLEAKAIAPFTTGLGNEHPLENGFAFLNPYGLPYLPGSGVKGVLRQAAHELASGEWGEKRGWMEEKSIELIINHKKISISMLDALFGLESRDGDTEHLRGALTFWDVLPQIAGNQLTVEIMTPHQSHYYLNGQSPHDSGSPNPISFLTVPPGSTFHFFVTCDTALLARHTPELAEGQRWKTLLQSAFEHAFEWLGFGAKTAVGYGAMLSDSQRSARNARRAEAAQRAQEERLAQNADRWEKAKITFNRRNGALTVDKGGEIAVATAPKGEELLRTLPKAIQDKIRSNGFQCVAAYVCDRTLLRVEAE